MTLSDRHRDELHASGVPDAMIADAQIYTTTGAEVSKILGWKPGNFSWGEAMVFPYLHANGYQRLKPDFPRTDKRGKPVKYETPKNAPNRAYFPPGFQARLAAAPPTTPVLVTEGEKKALCAAAAGYLCIGLVGVRGWHQPMGVHPGTGKRIGPMRLIPDLAGLSWGSRQVLVVFDSDAATNRQVLLAEYLLATLLARHGAGIKIVRLPQAGDAKVGLDDFVVAHGADAFAGILRDAETAAPLPDMQPADYAEEFINDRWLHADGYTLRRWRETTYHWNQRCYVPQGKEDFSAATLRWLNTEYGSEVGKPYVAKQVVECVYSKVLIPSQYDMPIHFTDAMRYDLNRRNWVVMANGILDIDKIRNGNGSALMPHSPRWFATAAVPYGYYAEADCPLWREFIHRAMDGDPARIALIQEWMGLNLVYDTSWEKFMILEGEGNNGKGVYLYVFNRLLGHDNVSNVSLEAFGQTFALSATIGKLANVIPEVSDISKHDEGLFKAFTGRDKISIDRKFKERVEIQPTARITIATNTRPRWADRSGGLWRRMLIIPWLVVIPEDATDKGLKERIAENELPGVFNWAIAGLLRLYEQDRFTDSSEMREIIEDYKSEMNPARAFIDDCITWTGDELDTAEFPYIYRAYAQYLQTHGYRGQLSDRHLGKEIHRVHPDVRSDRKRHTHGSPVLRYYGMRLETDVIV